ncbi:MAG: hypothetical protein ACKO3W_14590 [bacterium]
MDPSNAHPALSRLRARARGIARGFPRGLTRGLACAFVAALPLSAGCSFLERPAPSGSQYMLMLPAQEPVAGGKLGSAMVARFSAIPPFDERAFLYKTTDGTWRLDSYNGFMSDPSDMLCEGFARALERSGRFTMVGIEGISVRCDVTLDGIIEGFYADYTDAGGPAAVVEIRTYLLDGRGARTRLLMQMIGKGRAPIASDKPGDVAAAFSAATAQAIDAVVRALPADMGPMPPDAIAPQASAGSARSARPATSERALSSRAISESDARPEEVAVQPQNEG